MAGLGLLDTETIFASQKTRTHSTGRLSPVGGIFSALSEQEYEGYEIHMGRTLSGDATHWRKPLLQQGNVYGTYLHGVFDREGISRTIISALLQAKGLKAEDLKTFDSAQLKEQQYDLLAQALRKALDMEAVYRVLEEGA